MRRLISNAVIGIQVAIFAMMCLLFSPVILLQFGVSNIQERIRARWPDSDRARAVSFWFGLLAPIMVLVLIVTLLFVTAGRVRELEQRQPTHSSSGGH